MAGPRPGADPRALRALRPVAELEAEAIAFAHAFGEVPYARAARERFFREVRSRLHAAGAADGQLAIVDLVAALFDFAIDDSRLPEAARPLVWRLQQPVLLLALMDPGYLGDRERSLRVLVEELGAIADTYGAGWERGSELHERLETVVRALEIVAANLYGRLRVLSGQLEREQVRTVDGVRRLVQRTIRQRRSLEATPEQRNRRDYARRPGREQEREVTENISARLERSTHERVIPDTVHAFLSEVWLRVLRTTALRDGEESAAFRRAFEVVDQLLQSVDERSHHGDRAALAARIPALIERLHGGMREIGVRPESHQSFFDELFLIHLRRLQRGGREESRAGVTHARRPDTDEAPGASGAGAEGPGATYYDVGAVPVLDQRIASLEARVRSVGRPHGEPVGAAGSREPAESGETAGHHPSERQGGGPPATTVAADTGAGTRATGSGNGQPTRIGRVSDEPGTASNDDAGSDRLLTLVEEVVLDDFPEMPAYSNARASQQFSQLRAGQWLEYRARSKRPMQLKVAWINARRTVVILVRTPDRRAVSRPMSELADLFRRGKLRRVVPAAMTLPQRRVS